MSTMLVSIMMSFSFSSLILRCLIELKNSCFPAPLLMAGLLFPIIGGDDPGVRAVWQHPVIHHAAEQHRVRSGCAGLILAKIIALPAGILKIDGNPGVAIQRIVNLRDIRLAVAVGGNRRGLE